jgi:hypothetical protein
MRARHATLAGAMTRQSSRVMLVGVTHASVTPISMTPAHNRATPPFLFLPFLFPSSFSFLLSSLCGGSIGDLEFSPQIRAHGATN